jgi:nucleotide-binding universal stress UspA family protein
MASRYRRILVPLDGSSLAETAIGDAVSVGEATGAELVLLQAIQPITELLETNGHPLYVDEQVDRRRARALEYLDRVRHRIGGHVTRTRVAVEMGAPADVILDYVRANDIDLVVMATHGRSGVKRWVLGSIADKVLRGASGPVLLVRAGTPSP